MRAQMRERADADPGGLGEQRALVAQRLVEVIGWPESRISANERHLAADVLLPLIRTAGPELRRRCAEAVARLRDAPGRLLRYLACDEIEIATPILLEAAAFRDLDALSVAQEATPAHWRLLATRKDLTATVCDALVLGGDVATVQLLLQNPDIAFASSTVETLLRLSGQHPELAPALLERPELRPAQGLSLFWRCNAAGRLRALQRFAADRAVLLAEMGELFAQAKRERWRDPGALNALGFVERRQRRRISAEDLSLEEVILQVTHHPPVDEEGFARLAAVCGLTPLTVERVLTDPGGEPFAVLAKSVGLRWPQCEQLWLGLAFPRGAREDRQTAFGRMAYVYDTLPTAKAQTVLRYWNWSMMAEALARSGL